MTSTAVFVLSLAVLLFAGLAVFLFLQLQRRPGSSDGQALLQQQLESLRGQLAESLNSQSQSMNQQVHQMTTQVNQRLEDVSRRVADSQRAVGDRLDNAARVVGEVQKSLGVLGEASARIFDVGKDIAGLQEILRAPKMRGGLGEYFLADLLGQILPLKHFRLQHTFKTGATVDAVISLGGKLVPVDSKFPLENFRRVIEAKDDASRLTAKKQFVRDVKKHIDDIKRKYILPDEGTFDFALMYVMAENVYYEIIIKDEDLGEEDSVFRYAIKNKVIPVSPNSFYGYLQTILFGLRGLRVEQQAQDILKNLARLEGDFERVMNDFAVMGKHLKDSLTKFEDTEKRIFKFNDRLDSLIEKEEPVTLPLP